MDDVYREYAGMVYSPLLCTANQDDQHIKKVVEDVLHFSETLIEKVRDIFMEVNFPIPSGFTLLFSLSIKNQPDY